MEEIDINACLVKEDLFALFKKQLQKDFETAGVNADFVSNLPVVLEELKASVSYALEPLLRTNSSLLSGLLYRVDISEVQLRNYQAAHPLLRFEELLAELIIKRVLQKIILKKRFSG